MVKKYLLLLLLFSLSIPAGCFRKGLVKKSEPPMIQIVILPFSCENNLIGSAITKGFLDEIDHKVKIYDSNQFHLLLSSRKLREQDYFNPGDELVGSAAYWQKFSKTLSQDPELRKRLFQDTSIQYIVVGEAKEKDLTELEQGNLKTAETAEAKLFDLKTWDILVDSQFKQGFFEVVAPDRIGTKLADLINLYLKQVRKK